MPSRLMFLLRGLSMSGVLFLLATSTLVADFSLRDWRYVKSITLPATLGSDGLAELEPDPEVFAGSAPGLADLRVIADDGTEVPYKLELSRSERQRTPLSATLRDKGYVVGQYTTFVADLDREGLLHNEIEIHIPSTSVNFRRTATVETSGDGVAWTEVAEQPIYDFTVKERVFTTRDTKIRYTESTARYLRVKIADDGEGPLDISGATAFFVKETLAREVPWPVTIVSTSRDQDRRATLVEMDLGIEGLPTYRMEVKASDVNFYRSVTLEASANRKTWRTVLSGASIYSYDTPKFVGKNLVVTYPESTSRYLRLVVHDEDSPPLNLQGVELWGLQHRLVFKASLNQSHKLYYGNPEARRPSYDIERVFPYLLTEGLPRASLGAQAENPQFVVKLPPVSERFPWLLPAVVAVAGLLVALLLLGVIRQARKVLPPPAQ